LPNSGGQLLESATGLHDFLFVWIVLSFDPMQAIDPEESAQNQIHAISRACFF
jgi:hypothetical protein